MAVEPETWIDGRFVSGADVLAMNSAGYGALTSFLVDDGAVRGLDLHLARLARSARQLFGQDISADEILEHLGHALGGKRFAWVRISLFSDQITPRTSDAMVVPRVLITVSVPPAPIADGQRLMAVHMERFLPELKHNATMELLYARRMARLASYDDAVLVDRNGALTEGTLWNIGFIKNDTVVWPKGPMLDGVTVALIRRGLEDAGVMQAAMAVSERDLNDFDAAFLCNSSTPCAAIESIGEHHFDGHPAMLDKVAQAWRSNLPQRSVD